MPRYGSRRFWPVRGCKADVTDPRDRDEILTVHFDVTSWGTPPDERIDDPGAPPEITIHPIRTSDGTKVGLTDEQWAAVEAEILAEHLPDDRPDED